MTQLERERRLNDELDRENKQLLVKLDIARKEANDLRDQVERDSTAIREIREDAERRQAILTEERDKYHAERDTLKARLYNEQRELAALRNILWDMMPAVSDGDRTVWINAAARYETQIRAALRRDIDAGDVHLCAIVQPECDHGDCEDGAELSVILDIRIMGRAVRVGRYCLVHAEEERERLRGALRGEQAIPEYEIIAALVQEQKETVRLHAVVTRAKALLERLVDGHYDNYPAEDHHPDDLPDGVTCNPVCQEIQDILALMDGKGTADADDTGGGPARTRHVRGLPR